MGELKVTVSWGRSSEVYKEKVIGHLVTNRLSEKAREKVRSTFLREFPRRSNKRPRGK